MECRIVRQPRPSNNGARLCGDTSPRRPVDERRSKNARLPITSFSPGQAASFQASSRQLLVLANLHLISVLSRHIVHMYTLAARSSHGLLSHRQVNIGGEVMSRARTVAGTIGLS